MCQELIQHYTDLLAFAGMVVEQGGLVSTKIDDSVQPVTIDGKRLALPTMENLRNPGGLVIFHPLSESPLRGESEVNTKLREVINVRLNFVIGMIGRSLLSLVASEELHKNLSPAQLEVVLACRQADQTTVKKFLSVMLNGIKHKAESLFTHIYLNRGGSLNGVRYARTGTARFGFYQELLTKDSKPCGVDLRKSDREVMKALMEFMFPGIDVQDSYSYGSNSRLAPYLDALLQTSAKLAGRLNDLLSLFGDHIDCASSMMFNDAWVDAFRDVDSLSDFAKRVPAQAGNEGRSPINERSQAPAVAPTPAPQPVQQAVSAPALPIAQQPAPAPAPQAIPQAPQPPKTAAGKIDLHAAMQQRQAQAPVYQQPMAPMYQQPMYPQQQPMPAAMMPAQMQPNPFGQPMQMQREPSWAQPQMMYAQAPQPMYPQQQPMYPGQGQMVMQGQMPMQQVVDPRTGQVVLMPMQPQQPQPAMYTPHR